jgi:hypothetical protein
MRLYCLAAVLCVRLKITVSVTYAMATASGLIMSCMCHNCGMQVDECEHEREPAPRAAA